MGSLTVSQGSHPCMTMVSNRFIDEYMRDANDAQVKIYLYLLRASGSTLPAGVSDIADFFNHTEKDVLRALKYWDKLHVISLLYDDRKKLAGIRLENLSLGEPCGELPEEPAAEEEVTVSVEEDVYAKPSISAEQLKIFKNREDTSQLLFIAEQYFCRTLNPNEIRTIFYMTDVLHFSPDLTDYLMQYCIERDKKDFRYIEKVALNWAKSGITTPKQAAKFVGKYDRSVYEIMNALGRTSTPTGKELEYIYRFLKEYNFPIEIIKEACDRTVLATDRHRFEYADGILSSWKSASVHSLADIKRLDESFQKKKPVTAVYKIQPSGNSFNQFEQNQYNYDELLEKLKIN